MLALRKERRWSPDRIGPMLGLPPGTVHSIVRRHDAHRLSHPFPKPPRSFGQFDVTTPGELVAVDTKSLGGWTVAAAGIPAADRCVMSAGASCTWHRLASRVVFAELRPSVSDNGAGYKRTFHERRDRAGIRHTRTKPYHPWTNGRVESFNGTIQRECLYSQEFHSEEERELAVALPRLQQRRTPPHRTRWSCSSGVVNPAGCDPGP